jgi:hypothetical protein
MTGNKEVEADDAVCLLLLHVSPGPWLMLRALPRIDRGSTLN